MLIRKNISVRRHIRVLSGHLKILKFMLWTPKLTFYWMPQMTVKLNVLPPPGLLTTFIVPPIICTIRLAIESPIPNPPNCRVEEPSAWVNGSKILDSFSGGMPTPVSVTAQHSCKEASSLVPCSICATTFPSGENLMALLSSWRNTS